MRPDHSTSNRRLPRRRLCFAVVAIVLGTLAWRAIDILALGNFHTVREGLLYRAGQQSPYEFREECAEFGVKTVINLRGPAPGAAWYDDELSGCRELAMRHVDISWSAKRAPDPAQWQAFLAAVRESPRPILVHCKNGADRAGLASAAALLILDPTANINSARNQLGLWYGHMPVGPTRVMDRVFSQRAALFRTHPGRTQRPQAPSATHAG